MSRLALDGAPCPEFCNWNIVGTSDPAPASLFVFGDDSFGTGTDEVVRAAPQGNRRDAQG